MPGIVGAVEARREAAMCRYGPELGDWKGLVEVQYLQSCAILVLIIDVQRLYCTTHDQFSIYYRPIWEFVELFEAAMSRRWGCSKASGRLGFECPSLISL